VLWEDGGGPAMLGLVRGEAARHEASGQNGGSGLVYLSRPHDAWTHRRLAPVPKDPRGTASVDEERSGRSSGHPEEGRRPLTTTLTTLRALGDFIIKGTG
jgi:hypothetical protein